MNTKDRTAACSSRLRLLLPSKASRERILPFVIGCLLYSILGCTSRDSIERARARGVQAGHTDGQRAGETEGFQIGFKEAEQSSYAQALAQLHSSDDYYRPAFYLLAVPVVAFLLGYALQYSVLYLLRVSGFLTDIDWIVLSPEARDNLMNLPGYKVPTSSTQDQTPLLPSDTIHGQESA